MKVSVLMLAYNHGRFIAQALDSVLMQQVDFDYEIVIGEDCSKDNTRDILISYQQKYPDKIRLLLPEKNLGMHDNFIQTYQACRGQYIAILEGDDYWTSKHKLQKQVNFLDTHPECTVCFHSSSVLYEDGRTDVLSLHQFTEQKHNILTLEDLLSLGKNIMATASIMLRDVGKHEFPQWIYDVALLDWVIQIFNAQYGNVGYIDETMSLYRIHPQGNWSQKKHLERSLELAKMFQYLSQHLSSKYKKQVRGALSNYYADLVICYEADGDRNNAKKYITRLLLNDLLNNKLLSRLSFKASLLLRVYLPNLHKTLKSFKLQQIS
ncbi:glycosyltransferase [Nostoc sp. FACHB-152]|uniref:glycosyltransferase n=1 Tax=unclassified Nostoc TaxID=2593658 RepID=UPI0016856131|nr:MULTISPECIES: glycosyltransferase [unclassified Nostoc]MBD2451081.1 glycosyltransferase [Nostoc sp. FACHB-152]MBD2472585.1 glycosyltransferase [Nostoc sp. FACHB-145]